MSFRSHVRIATCCRKDFSVVEIFAASKLDLEGLPGVR